MSKFKVTALLGALILPIAAAGPAAADQHATCEDPGVKKITRLGISPVSSQPINDRAAMASYLESIRPAIDAIMARKGMSDRTDEVYAALRSGDGVSEEMMQPGDVLEWMIFRTGAGKVGVGPGPYCLATSESYEAFRIDLVDREDLGAQVRTTTTTFLIPKICANLALGGTRTETTDKPAPPPPPPPPAPKPEPREVAPPAPAPVEEEMPEPAEEREIAPWKIRGFLIASDGDAGQFTVVDTAPGGTLALGQAEERTDLKTSAGGGVGLNVEYRANDRIGIEGGLLYWELDSMLSFDSATEWLMAGDSTNVLTITAGLNFHLTPNQKVDFYIGPYIGMALIDNASFALGGSVGTVSGNTDDEFVWGGQIGLDIPFGGSGWAFHLGARYMDLGVGGDGVDLDIDPLMGTAGLAYSF